MISPRQRTRGYGLHYFRILWDQTVGFVGSKGYFLLHVDRLLQCPWTGLSWFWRGFELIRWVWSLSDRAPLAQNCFCLGVQPYKYSSTMEVDRKTYGYFPRDAVNCSGVERDLTVEWWRYWKECDRTREDAKSQMMMTWNETKASSGRFSSSICGPRPNIITLPN